MRVTVRVPATSANLGPGFDCFGLALDLCNEVTIDTEAEPGVTWEGEGADELPTDGSDLVSTVLARSADADGLELPPMAVHGVNRIPLERGLGSSAAAAVAASVLINVLFGSSVGPGPREYGPVNEQEIFANAAWFEGHPDNAAPAVFGGVTVSPPDGGHAYRFDPHPDLRPVVLVPTQVRSATAEARRVLDPSIPRADAIFNVSRAALLLQALLHGPTSLLSIGIHDRLHQDARLERLPGVRTVFDAVREANLPVCVSGAGPSLLAFEIDGHEVPDPGDGWTMLRPGVRAKGFEVSVER